MYIAKIYKKGDKNMSKLVNKNAGIFKTKVNVSEFFNDPEDPNPQDFWILFRENNQEESMEMAAIASRSGFSTESVDASSKDFTPEKAAAIAELNVFVKKCIIDHNFETENDTKMKTDDLWDLVMQRPECINKINDQRNKESGPLQKKSATK